MRYFTTSLLFAVISPLLMMAAPFQNLDFESPRLPITQPDIAMGWAIEALPGWQLSPSAIGSDRVLLNVGPLGGAAVSFYGPLTLQPNPNLNLYAVRLYSGFLGGSSTGVSISQAGDIPESARSLRLDARVFGEYRVTLDGSTISMSLTRGGTDYDTYYGDISNFSGKTAELKIETGAGTNPFDQPLMYIDKISFSTLVVPEPSIYALLALGLFGLGWRARQLSKPRPPLASGSGPE